MLYHVSVLKGLKHLVTFFIYLVFDRQQNQRKLKTSRRRHGGGEKNVIHPNRVGGTGGVQQRLSELARVSKICENDPLRLVPLQAGGGVSECTRRREHCLPRHWGLRFGAADGNLGNCKLMITNSAAVYFC